eukprot:GHVS01074722.1.p1 GENE.GHVS01074722.1~~GHVS01074722.1.p1  ORF type:complete len:948 (-),score=157.43 GHVS01074722.1:211-3054(-)
MWAHSMRLPSLTAVYRWGSSLLSFLLLRLPWIFLRFVFSRHNVFVAVWFVLSSMIYHGYVTYYPIHDTLAQRRPSPLFHIHTPSRFTPTPSTFPVDEDFTATPSSSISAHRSVKDILLSSTAIHTVATFADLLVHLSVGCSSAIHDVWRHFLALLDALGRLFWTFTIFSYLILRTTLFPYFLRPVLSTIYLLWAWSNWVSRLLLLTLFTVTLYIQSQQPLWWLCLVNSHPLSLQGSIVISYFVLRLLHVFVLFSLPSSIRAPWLLPLQHHATASEQPLFVLLAYLWHFLNVACYYFFVDALPLFVLSSLPLVSKALSSSPPLSGTQLVTGLLDYGDLRTGEEDLLLVGRTTPTRENSDDSRHTVQRRMYIYTQYGYVCDLIRLVSILQALLDILVLHYIILIFLQPLLPTIILFPFDFKVLSSSPTASPFRGHPSSPGWRSWLWWSLSVGLSDIPALLAAGVRTATHIVSMYIVSPLAAIHWLLSYILANSIPSMLHLAFLLSSMQLLHAIFSTSWFVRSEESLPPYPPPVADSNLGCSWLRHCLTTAVDLPLSTLCGVSLVSLPAATLQPGRNSRPQRRGASYYELYEDRDLWDCEPRGAPAEERGSRLGRWGGRVMRRVQWGVRTVGRSAWGLFDEQLESQYRSMTSGTDGGRRGLMTDVVFLVVKVKRWLQSVGWRIGFYLFVWVLPTFIVNYLLAYSLYVRPIAGALSVVGRHVHHYYHYIYPLFQKHRRRLTTCPAPPPAADGAANREGSRSRASLSRAVGNLFSGQRRSLTRPTEEDSVETASRLRTNMEKQLALCYYWLFYFIVVSTILGCTYTWVKGEWGGGEGRLRRLIGWIPLLRHFLLVLVVAVESWISRVSSTRKMFARSCCQFEQTVRTAAHHHRGSPPAQEEVTSSSEGRVVARRVEGISPGGSSAPSEPTGVEERRARRRDRRRQQQTTSQD